MQHQRITARRFLRLALLVPFALVSTTAAQPQNCGYVPDIGTKKIAFSFAIWGDPQVAYWAPNTKFDNPSNKSKYEVVTPRLRRTVSLTNTLQPEFVVTLGDNIHNTGEWENFQVLFDAIKALQPPLYMLMGNHDHVPKADTFATNPVKNVEFANFLSMQKLINAPELVNYSFDAGDWHLVLFSQPGGDGYGVDDYFARHPEFLDWLEADLAANQFRPTIFFTHHPLLPAGHVRFDHYGPGAIYRAKLVDILTRHGNVKYAFFGHVHNTVASIPLLSWQYQNTAFVVLPNAANSVRLNDYQERAESSWGVGMVKLNGPFCEAITFHTLAGEVITIDTKALPEYDEAVYGYLMQEGELPFSATIRNGDFEQPLASGWFLNHLLPYDTPPVLRRERRSDPNEVDNHHLYLYAQASHIADDSESYIIAQVRQAVVKPAIDKWPVLKLKYKIASADYQNPSICNAFIEVAGYRKGVRGRQFALAYSLGRTFEISSLRGAFVSLELKPALDSWQELVIYPRSDFNRYFPELNWERLALDNLVITLGVFNDNYSPDQNTAKVGVSYDDVQWYTVNQPTPLTSVTGNYERERPTRYTLYPIYPNPFNAGAKISFALRRSTLVRLRVYDTTGRLVTTVQEGEMEAGYHTLSWTPASGLATGVYFAKLQVDDVVQMKKMLYLK